MKEGDKKEDRFAKGSRKRKKKGSYFQLLKEKKAHYVLEKGKEIQFYKGQGRKRGKKRREGQPIPQKKKPAWRLLRKKRRSLRQVWGRSKERGATHFAKKMTSPPNWKKKGRGGEVVARKEGKKAEKEKEMLFSLEKKKKSLHGVLPKGYRVGHFKQERPENSEKSRKRANSVHFPKKKRDVLPSARSHTREKEKWSVLDSYKRENSSKRENLL